MLRKDQITMLEDLAERLADVFLEEADPLNWSGAGTPMADMTKEQRGNRHWDRKGAMGTGGVLKFTLDIAAKAKDQSAPDGSEVDADLEAQVAEAQKRASAAMLRIVDGGKKAEFMARAAGVKKG